MTAARALRFAALAAILVAGTAAGNEPGSTAPSPPVKAASPEAAPEPLTNSDIVRMVAAGRSRKEIIRRIAVSAVEFDLSEEMTGEMRAVGVSDEILQAMARRQRETAPRKVDEEPALPPGFTTVRVSLTEDGDAIPSAIYFPTSLWDDLANTLQVGRRPQDREVKDLALFLACRTPQHIPGLWRSASPLGRDFVSMPPHQVVAFESGAAAVPAAEVPEEIRAAIDRRNGEAPPPQGWLRLAVPPSLTGEVEADTPHDLMLGVAALVGDHYLCLGSAKADRYLPTPERPAHGSVRPGGTRGKPFDVRLDAPSGERRPG